MSGSARLVLGLVALALVGVLFLVLGPAEATAVILGIALLAGTAWLGPRTVRVSGALCLALVAFGVGRAVSSPVFGVVCALVAAALAARYAPPRVRRRVTVHVPSLVLLVVVTTLLMYHAPGNPVAAEKLANYGEDDHDLRMRRAGGTRTYRIGTVAPGDVGELEARLLPGRFTLWCSLADHRKRGMTATLVVRPR